MQTSEPEPGAGGAAQSAARLVTPRWDFLGGLAWIAFGTAVAIGSWRMDRLENQDVNPYTVPGLLPGLLGLAIGFFGTLLLARAWRKGALGEKNPRSAAMSAAERKRFLIVMGICIAFGLCGALLCILVGSMPGLSATLCIALLTTLTVKLPANDAILILVCSYVGTLYGGSRSAILLNIPGTAANAASCADGHALALRGEAGRAIGIATSGAFCGTLFGVICLTAFTPLLAEVALSFGAFEFFWLALFGVAMSGSLVGDDPLKGWLMGLLGLFVAQIGQE